MSFFRKNLKLDVREGLIAQWKFDETGSDITVIDSTVFRRHGKLMNGAFRDVGRIGKAVSLDGVNDYVTILTPSAYFPTTTGIIGTMSLWVYCKGDNLDGAVIESIFCQAMNGVNNNYSYGMAYVTSTAVLRYAATNGTNGNFAFSYSKANFYNKWRFLTQVFDGSASRLYIDGVNVDSNVMPVSQQTPSANIIIGNVATVATNAHFNGLVEDLRFYNRALSAQEIKIIYNYR